MTQKPWAQTLRATAMSAPLLIAERYARVSHICRNAAERDEPAVIDAGREPRDPVLYLESHEEAFLNAVLKAVTLGRLDLAADIARNLGMLYETRSQLAQRFVDRWDEILCLVSDAAAEAPDDITRAVVLVLLARRQRVRNQWAAAHAKAAEALAWCAARTEDENQVRLLEAEACEIMGEIYRSYGSPSDLDDAIAHFRRGLSCVARADAGQWEKRRAELQLRDRLGYALYLRGDHQLAVAELARSIRLHGGASTNPSELSRTLNNLGKVLGARGRRRAAHRCFQCSLDIKRARGDERGEAVCHHEIGLLHRTDGEPQRAIEKLVQSLRIKRKIDDKHGIGLSYMELGFTFEVLGDHCTAEKYFKDAVLFLTPQSAQYARVKAHVTARTLDVGDLESAKSGAIRQ